MTVLTLHPADLENGKTNKQTNPKETKKDDELGSDSFHLVLGHGEKDMRYPRDPSHLFPDLTASQSCLLNSPQTQLDIRSLS